jgi:hypothetical protein
MGVLIQTTTVRTLASTIFQQTTKKDVLVTTVSNVKLYKHFLLIDIMCTNPIESVSTLKIVFIYIVILIKTLETVTKPTKIPKE